MLQIADRYAGLWARHSRGCLCACGHALADHNYHGAGHCFYSCPDENGRPRDHPEACQRFVPKITLYLVRVAS